MLKKCWEYISGPIEITDILTIQLSVKKNVEG